MLLKFLLTTLVGCLPLLSFNYAARGQNASASPPSFATEASAAVQQLYRTTTAIPAQLYNGPQYVDYSLRYSEQKGHQFFLDTEPQLGDVTYRQQPFRNLLLRYDIVLDQVVLGLPESPLLMRLLGEQLPQFTIAGHSFVRVVADSTVGNVLNTGYYEVLHDGRVQLLARRAKRKQDRIVNKARTVEFIPTDKLFARKDGVYYPLKSASAALKLFADRQAEVQTYMQQNKVKLRKSHFENTMGVLVDFYNQLPPR